MLYIRILASLKILTNSNSDQTGNICMSNFSKVTVIPVDCLNKIADRTSKVDRVKCLLREQFFRIKENRDSF